MANNSELIPVEPDFKEIVRRALLSFGRTLPDNIIKLIPHDIGSDY